MCAWDSATDLHAETVNDAFTYVENNFKAVDGTNAGFIYNEAGGDYDWRMEGDTDANLFFLDASTDRIGIGVSDPAATLEVFSDSTDNDKGIYVDNQGTATGIQIDQTGVLAASAAALKVVCKEGSNQTGGGFVCYLGQDDADSSDNVLNIVNDGTGKGILIDQNGDCDRALYIDTEQGNDKELFAVVPAGTSPLDWALIRNDDVNGNMIMRLGIGYYWTDSTGDLRTKNANPTSDTDGTVVGTQS